ncbi:DUF1775 domain-containing protein [Agitococcus lubricus]|uniref:Uncharacterized protein YcnI n=1 Tax=Agitococcus lubricus TaxID=1077255 RepID=A0A2T5IZL0_9GAMM|nr:DUF1775 domain-containing protein [Agitococcus lubricus]PTQ89381.1 uncharacterized protein YcnI [Agitococcus lubricus]
MLNRSVLAMTLVGALVASQFASAHVGFFRDSNNLPITGNTIIATLNVPHGCHDAADVGYDTNKIEVKMPAGVALSSVMPMHSTFGKVKIVKDNAGKVSSLVWEQKTEDVQTEASHFYQVSFRVALSTINGTTTTPIPAFSTLGFETTQYCGANNQLSEVWTGANTPTLYILPKRGLGWNKYTVPNTLDLTGTAKNFFTDAAIVWKNKEGHSANGQTLELIKKNATQLLTIPAGSDIWVKY